MMNGVKQTKDGNWWSELVVNCVMSPLCWDDCNTDFTFSIINLSYFVYFVLTSRGKKSYWTINNKLGSLTYCRTGINHVAYCIVVCEWNLLRFQNCFHLIEYKFLPMQNRLRSLPKKSIHNYATNTYCMFSGQDHLSKFKKIQFNNSSLVKKGKLPFFYIQ